MTTSGSGKRLRPVIRVFVSSTFSDMKHERNALEADAFPKLEQLCQRHGFQFQAIDLRWGVSTEAGLDHRTMQICYEELRRSQEISPEPNFLILLGNRYGWRPLPEAISQKEYENLRNAAMECDKDGKAIIKGIGDKSAEQILKEWYRLDENILPSDRTRDDPDCAPLNYILQSRLQVVDGHLKYGRRKKVSGMGDEDTPEWIAVQNVLWNMINAAFPADARFKNRFKNIDGNKHIQDVDSTLDPKRTVPQIVRFQGSATEQEIWSGALSVPHADQHVLAFFREIENRAAFSDPKQIENFVDVDPSGTLQIEQLKAELRLRLGSSNLFHNEAPVRLVEAQDNQGDRRVDITTDHLDQLCANVVSRLSESIQGQIDEYWHNTSPASMNRAARELEIEQREYERFAKERGGEESFVGRQVELQSILDYMGSDSCWPLVIHGASGCGKTALLACASQEVAKTRKRIERFIGVAPRSSDLRSLLSSLCQELRQRNPRTDVLPTEIKELRDEFSRHLQVATPEQPLILFLDALDQLADADNGRLLHWLPLGSLPAHVKLVVSCLSDRADGDLAGQPYAELKHRQIPTENFINLNVLSEAEARLLLFDRWLPNTGRKVSDDQRAQIEQRLASPTCRQPIFLKMLFEEVRFWHSYDPAPVPGESVPALLGQLFDRLSLETNHGPLLVNRVLGYLSASRHGLAENEILEILFADPEYRAKLNEATEQTRQELPPNAKRIPITLWSRLRFDLAPYLTERAAPGANVLTFYHRQVGEAARGKYMSGDNELRSHRALAGYFHKQHNYLESIIEQHAHASHPSTMSRQANLRKVDELPWQRLQAQQWDKLGRLLTDVSFLEAKVAAGMLHSLIEDYNSAFKASGNTKVSEWSSDRRSFGMSFFLRALRKNAEFISDVPTATRTQLILTGLNEAFDHKLLVGRFAEKSLLVPSRAPAEIANPHSEEVVSVTASGDCQRVATCDLRGQVIIWDVMKRRWLTRYTAVKGRAEVVCFLDLGGVLLAAACEDGSIYIAESSTGDQRARLCKHKSQLLALTSNGTYFASGGVDERVFLWETRSLRFLTEVGESKGRGMIQSLAFGAGHYLLVGTHTGRVECWDLSSPTAPKLCYQFNLPTPSNRLGPSSIEQVAFVPRTRYACVSDWEPKITIFDAISGQSLNQVRHPGSYAPRFAPTQDGKTLVCSHDKGLMAFAVPSGQHLWKIDADMWSIGSLVLLEEDRSSFTGHSDSSVAIWDLADRKRIWAQPGVRNSAISAAAIDPSRAICVSGGTGGQISAVDLETEKTLYHVKTDIGYVCALDVCAVNNVFAALGWSRYTIVASTTTGHETMRFPTAEFGRMVCLNPQGDRLAIGCEQDLTVFDLASQTSLFRTKDALTAWIVSGLFSDNPDFLYLGDSWGICHEIQLSTGGVRHLNPGNNQIRGWCQFLTVLEAQKCFISAAGSQLFVWDLLSGCVQRKLIGHRSDVCTGTLSKDGKWLITGDEHGRIILWETASWRIVGGALLQAPIRVLTFDQIRSCLWAVDAARGIYQFALQ